MRIVGVSPRVIGDLRGGSQVRMAAIYGALARGHELTVFSQTRPDQLSAAPSGYEVAHVSRLAATIGELPIRTWPTAPLLSGATLRVSRPRSLPELIRRSDVTMVEFPWQFAAAASHADGCRLVLSSHNVEAEKFPEFARASGKGRSAWPWLRFVERVERRAVERSDLILAVSEADRQGFVERYGVDESRVVVAPNAADLVAIEPADRRDRDRARRSLGLPDGRPVVIYAGGMVTPNLRGLEWVRELARRTDRYTFLVVGRVGGHARREGNLVYTGFVDDFRSCLAAADIALCPIEFGGGTKIKLIESLAAGLPTVVFEESLRGMHARAGEHVVVAEKSAEALLAELDRLAGDPGMAARLGTAARRHAEERHDCRATAARIEEALSDLVAGSPGHRRGSARARARTAPPRPTSPASRPAGR